MKRNNGNVAGTLDWQQCSPPFSFSHFSFQYHLSQLWRSFRMGSPLLSQVFQFLLATWQAFSYLPINSTISTTTSSYITSTPGSELCSNTEGDAYEVKNSNHVNYGSDNSTCLTPECIRLAASYLNNMNRDANPCEDFYEFACGKYATRKVIAEHEKKVTVLSEMKKEMDRHLKGNLKSHLKSKVVCWDNMVGRCPVYSLMT